VILQIGQYQLLVADACAGLQTLLTLEALGLFYLNLMRHPSAFRNIGLALFIVPISFSANVIRVIVLTLITYYFGDAAGQGFLHGFAGMVLFVTALVLILSIDSALQWTIRRREARKRRCARRRRHEPPFRRQPGAGPGDGRHLGPDRRPHAQAEGGRGPGRQFSLDTMIPARFAGWTVDTSVVPLTPDPTQKELIAALYDQTLSRTYVNAQGQRVMLSIAYGGDQSKQLQLHLPEVCYVAQGFDMVKDRRDELGDALRQVPVKRLVARQNARNEPITYWVTIGDKAVMSGIDQKMQRLVYGLSGRIPDGMLVRVSTISPTSRRLPRAGPFRQPDARRPRRRRPRPPAGRGHQPRITASMQNLLIYIYTSLPFIVVAVLCVLAVVAPASAWCGRAGWPTLPAGVLLKNSTSYGSLTTMGSPGIYTAAPACCCSRCCSG
jgi:EpsI family protein